MKAVRVLMSTLVGVTMLLFFAPLAWAADDYLVASDPQPRQETRQVPGWVTLAFKSTASAKLAKILVLDKDGKNVTTGALIVEGTNVTTQLMSGLPKGTYTVYYRTSGSDGEKRGGAFQFSYGPGTWTAINQDVWVGEKEEPPVLQNPDPNATAPASATPSVQPTQSSPSASAAPSSAEASRPAVPPTSGGNALPWIIGGGVVVLAAAGGGAWFLWKRRSQG
jgi:methionine-rich copper-binding protein CopC